MSCCRDAKELLNEAEQAGTFYFKDEDNGTIREVFVEKITSVIADDSLTEFKIQKIDVPTNIYKCVKGY